MSSVPDAYDAALREAVLANDSHFSSDGCPLLAQSIAQSIRIALKQD